MNFSLKTSVLALIAILLYAINSSAQIDSNRFTVLLSPQSLATCGAGNNSLEEVFIRGKNASCHDFSITFDLPPGVEYVANSVNVTAQSGSGDFVVTYGGTPSKPIFTVQRPGDANWQVGDEVTFTFLRSANCEAVKFLNSGGLFKDAHTINFQDVNGANSDSDTEPTISSYSLMAASLNISAIPTINANVGETYTRNITLAQGGNGCTETFTYYVDLGVDVDDAYTLSYAGEVLNPVSKVGQVLTYEIDLNQSAFDKKVGDGLNNCFDNGEVIVFEEEFRVDDCLDTAIVHNTYWGCSAGEVCQAAAPQTGSLNFGANVPDISLTKVGSTNPDLCKAVTYTVKIENTNATAGSMALDVGIILGRGGNTTPVSTADSNPLWGYERHKTRKFSNFRFGTNPSFLPNNVTSDIYATTTTNVIPPNFFTSDPDGAGGFDDLDNDGFYDDLPPGESTELSFDFELSPKNNCGTGRFDYLEWEHTYFDVYFKDQCKSDRIPERIDLNYFNIIRDYRSVTEIDAPTDIVNNEDFTIKIAPSMQANGVGTPTIDGEALFADNGNTEWSITIEVPAGMSLQASASSEFTQIGNFITYSTTNINNISVEFKDWVEFPLTFSCGPNGLQAIPYTTNFKATGSNGTCWDQNIHCGTINIYTHCPGPCVGPAIEGFDAKRITAGWTDASMATKVVLDDNTGGLNKYMAGDQMEITTIASINNISLDNLYFDLTYNTQSLAAGGSDIITLVDAQITINDTPTTSQSGAITNSPVLTTNGTTEHRLSFDLSDYRSLIGGTYNYEGDASEQDIVELVLTFEFSKDFDDIDYYELTKLRGEFFGFTDYPANTAANRVGCDTWGDRAFYSRPRINHSNQSRATNGCAPSNGVLYWTHNMGPDDMHPDEYRPTTIWKNTVVDIPEGARFTGNITSVQFESNSYSTTTGEFVATESNGQIIITPGPGFVNMDQNSLIQPRFYVEFMGTCESPPSAKYQYTINFENFAYTDTPEAASITGTNTFTYTQPTFIVQSPAPTVNGDAYTVDFDTNISNTSPEDVDYNWLQITTPAGINLNSAFTVSGGVETPANFYQSGDKMWIEAGSIATGDTKTVRFKGDFDDCQDLTVLVEHGWDCSGYPGYPNTSTSIADYSAVGTTCYQNSTSITLEPKGAQVQVAITDEPAGAQDLCTPFNIGVDMISAQLADLTFPYLEFAIPGGDGGITIVNTNVEYPKNSGNIESVTVTVTNGTARVNIMEHSGIAAINGIAGDPAVNTIDERTAHIDLEIQLECDFISNSEFTFKAYGESPCGDIAAGNGSRVVSSPVEANGAVAPYNALSTIYASPVQGCGITDKISVETTITGGTTGGSDFAKISLRTGIEYVASSFSSADGASFVSINTVGNHQELILQYPAGVTAGSRIDFDFDFISTNEGICDDLEEVRIVNYVTVGGITCSATNCADFQVATGSSYEIMPLEKPILIGTPNDSFFTIDTSNNYEYNLSLEIENGSSVDANADYAYSVYCADVNGDIDGAAIATGTVASAIASGASVTEEIMFTTAGAACSGTNFIVEFLPSSTNCQCEAILIEVPVVSGAPLDLDNDNDGIPDAVEVYNGDADGDGTLDYEDPDFCAANFDGVDGWACTTMGLPDPDGDLDGDGTPNYYDADFPTCGGLNANGVCINFDTDGDGIPNHLDLDSDNDGITDIVEVGEGNRDSNGDGVLDNITDVDNDGLADVVDNDTTDGPEGSAPCTPQTACVQTNSTSNIFDTDGDGTTDNSGDFDGDGLINAYDLDSDNDGILDTVEAQTTTGFSAPGAIDPLTGIPAVGTDTDGIDPIDTDGDGNPDYLDLDADNDGITDTLEAGGIDADGDGAVDGFVDADSNGVADSVDSTPLPDEDSDNDGILDRLDLDSDNDGITDTTEAGGMDGDGDGIIDTFMTDTDNDGLADSVDPVGPATPGTPIPNPDTDNDGLDDRIDLDSENDGIPDVIEAGGPDPDNDGRIGTGPIADTDGDGLSDLVDPNDNTTGTLDDGPGTPLPIDNFDGDSVPNHLDIDSDNDGITDTTEAGGLDVNGDGVVDGFDDTTTTDGWDDATAASPLPIPNSDTAGGPDYLDIDADDDGIPDNVEAQATAGYIAPADAEAANGLDTNYPVGLTPVDTDNDLIPDYLDADSDADDVSDVEEAGQGTMVDPLADADGDGLNDAFDDTTPAYDVNNDLDTGAIATDNVDDLDTAEVDFRSILDSDNDGIMDTVDIDDDNDGILDVDETGDTDGDGIPDSIDLDSDNDGIPDTIEAGGTDTDGDGHIDYPTPGDPSSMTDTNNDGLADEIATTPLPDEDSDGDGIEDRIDLDSDNDGIPDVTEAGGPDADNDGVIDTFATDTDRDGLADSVDPADATTPGTPLENPDTDGDGFDDRIDTDSDNDGIPDVTEAGGSDPDNDGVIGTGPIADADGDGLSDIADTDDSTTPTATDGPGTALPIDNFDGDANPNHLDIDADNDGILDVIENGTGALDTNNDGAIDKADDVYADANDNGQADATEGTAPLNTDTTGGANYIDIDADDDGIPDNVEAQPTAAYNAPDDAFDAEGLDTQYAGGITPEDTDNDLIPDYLDPDSDDDGTPDSIEAGQGTMTDPLADADNDGLNDAFDDTLGTDVNNDLDTGADGTDNVDDVDTAEVDFRSILDRDQDGIMDIVDLDDDNDGISDLDEANGVDPSADDDNDGIVNYLDDAPADPLVGDVNGIVEPAFDFDGDGIPNHFDIDADNDGIFDVYEAGNDALDTNNDGVIDSVDTGFLDANNDGQADSSEGTIPLTTDTTGGPDFLDIDADDDGIPDNVEAQPTDAYVVPADAFNRDGVDTNYPNGLRPEDTDSDLTPDYIDFDSDDDGTSDVVEAGQGAITDPLADADGDGLNDAFDDTSGNDVNNDLDTGAILTDNEDDVDTAEVDFRSILDRDQDGIMDIVDLDDDNDGIPDLEECSGMGSVSLIPDGDFGVADVANDTYYNGAGNGSGNPDNYNTYTKPMPASITTTYGNGEPRPSDGNYALVTNSVGLSYVAGEPIPNFWLDIEDYTTDAPGEIGYFALFNADGTAGRFYEQTITGLKVGETYEFKTAIINLFNPGYADNGTEQFLGTTPIAPNVSMLVLDSGGTIVDQYNSGDIPNDGEWKEVSLIFTATDTSMTFAIDNNTGGGVGNDFGIDGISLTQSCDFDGDGIPNPFDLDSDNDGILDIVEAGGTDTDNDGRVDGFTDANDDGLDDDTAANPLPLPNTDTAGNPNFLDIDADDDGIPDNVEAQPTTSYIVPADAFNRDGVDTNYPTGLIPEDTDGDLTPDYLDLDSEDDGISDMLEAGQGTLTDALADTDGDGLNDAFDDTPGNDVNNDLNTGAIATDNEDDSDVAEVDFRSVLDFDGDGIPDTVDLDDDNDGISDLDEANGIDPSADDDNDGVPNHSDDNPSDPAIGDVNGTTEPAFDFDGDGIPNHFDIDADNDGIVDVVEAGNGDLDTNNDGVIDSNDAGFADATGNGQADSSEGTTPPNTDGSGEANFLDIDADDDGIPDNVEAQPTDAYIVPADAFDTVGLDTNYPGGIEPEDTDNDGTPDYIDDDSDADGISDMLEAGQGTLTDALADTDGDGLNDAFDDTPGIDVNNDLDTGAIATDNEDDADVAEVDFRSMLDFDQDGIPDTVDLDDDNDGISDLDEANGIDPSADDDNDGVPNHSDDNPSDPAIGDVNGITEPAFDFDGDGIPNHFDIDADNDGIVDVVEAGNGDLDTNNDGVIDSNDAGFADATGNGQADSSEGTTPPNTDGSGEANFLDIDADDDGIPDNVEAQPTDAYIVPADAFDTVGLDTNYPGGIEPEDTDNDGTPDYIDDDSDADGISDMLEAGQGTLTDPLADADGDGLNDAYDDTPGNDVNNDLDTGAIATDNEDDADLTQVDFRDVLDFDGDGIPDTADLDDDNDGISDLDEANGIDPSADDDNDGVPNHSDDNPSDPAIGDVNGTTEPAFDFDGDGIPNHFDIDADNDGIVDVVEAGNGDLDTNNDGVIDSSDDGFADTTGNGQADSSEGTVPPNTDGTGKANYLDIDADDDGIPDNVEAQPTDAYIVPADAFDTVGLDTNYLGGLVPEDTDGDGTPDYLDLDSEDDGILDIEEAGQGTFTGVDSDSDGLDDGFDDTPGLDVNNDLDTGTDGTDNDDDTTTPEVDFREIGDSDGDGVLDTQEEADGTDKNNPCDYVIENVTLAFSGDYLVADCDGDGVINGQEIDDETNPEDPCDYIERSITLEQGGDYLISDCDVDGLTTSQEEAIGTDPDVADTDGDTISDGQEIEDGTDPLDPCDSLNGVPTLAAGCSEELVETGISVINEIITADGDGINEEFLIDNIESYPDNTVQIYNRWGIIVYEMNGYDNVTNTFKGVSNGRITISTDSKLPVGTYFYIIKYDNKGEKLSKVGHLYLNR
ncbi:gliding motility-associated C-terminal domain-containing protein [Zobellia uliginosa]|uniref:Gliding motility-associated C-terminal domain-containing protein n=1 Tax=Zobellia uliginosa TaxID=143224 RepID=A0ABY1KM95_9FLAO|nr:gliding motility-associated C-terminal domain-containing protein [Zobellia uliginosa]SIS49355.1 gliding motility-associated C-terminal domain-containing protein [Zobellia uliginosa]